MIKSPIIIEPVRLSCRDCTHSRYQWRKIIVWGTESAWLCSKKIQAQEEDYNPVTGEITVIPSRMAHCRDERRHSGSCGPEAKNWQPKKPEGLFDYIRKSAR